MREENIANISEYLRENFSGSRVEDEAIGTDHVFRIFVGDPPVTIGMLKVSGEYLEDTAPLRIEEELERYDVAAAIRSVDRKTILFTSHGVEVLEEE
jgi:hypothetical protein